MSGDERMMCGRCGVLATLDAPCPAGCDDAPAAPTITVSQVIDGAHGIAFVAHGPDGHGWLLKRLTQESAAKDELAYFLATRTLRDGRWVLS